MKLDWLNKLTGQPQPRDRAAVPPSRAQQRWEWLRAAQQKTTQQEKERMENPGRQDREGR